MPVDVEDSYPKIRRNLLLISAVMTLASFSALVDNEYTLLGAKIYLPRLTILLSVFILWGYALIRFLQARTATSDDRLSKAIQWSSVQLMHNIISRKAQERTGGKCVNFALPSHFEGIKESSDVLCKVRYDLTQDDGLSRDHSMDVRLTCEEQRTLEGQAKRETTRRIYTRTTYFTDHKLPIWFAGIAAALFLFTRFVPLVRAPQSAAPPQAHAPIVVAPASAEP